MEKEDFKDLPTWECSNCGGTWFKELGMKCPSCGTELPWAGEEEEKTEGETPEGEKPEEKPEEPEEKTDLDELLKKSRDELNALAEEKDLDPGDYHNKEEIANAILEAEE